MQSRGTGQWWAARVGCRKLLTHAVLHLGANHSHGASSLPLTSCKPLACQIVDAFVSLFNGTGLGTGLALHSDSSLLLHHASPGARLLLRLCPTHVPHSLLCQTAALYRKHTARLE